MRILCRERERERQRVDLKKRVRRARVVSPDSVGRSVLRVRGGPGGEAAGRRAGGGGAAGRLARPWGLGGVCCLGDSPWTPKQFHSFRVEAPGNSRSRI